jgi:hypothetical protein
LEQVCGLHPASLSQGLDPLNILGTGTLTRQLIPIIKEHPQLSIEYTVTDASYSLVADLAKSLELDRLIPKAYDPTKDPYSQGFSPESFDIIIAYHALHVAPELKTLTRWLHDLLVPRGLLFAAAIDTALWSDKPGAAWVDFTFGSFAEWSSYQDECDHCSISTSQWEALLHESGFHDISPITGSNYSLDFIFTCQKKSESMRKAIEPLPAVTLYQYKDGEEIRLQQCLLDFGPRKHDVMCLWTDSKYDGDSAMGLVMTLAREFTTWTIWLAMFDGNVDLATVEEVIKVNHIHLAREHLVYFSADGTPSFPRVVRLQSMAEEPTIQTFSHLLANHLIIRVTDYDIEGGFVGNVVKSTDPEIPEKSFVAGLSPNIRGNALLTVHSGRVVKVDQLDHRVLPYLPAMFLQFQCLGSCFMHPLRGHPSLQVLIALRSENLTQALRHLFDTSCDINVLTEAPDSFVDVLVTDHETLEADPLLEQNVGTNGRVVIWSPQLLERIVSQEPLVLRHVFGTGIHNFKFPPLETPRIADLDGDVWSLPFDELEHISLLDPHKVYLLIGGIGGIGLHLAVWLYQVCLFAAYFTYLYSNCLYRMVPAIFTSHLVGDENPFYKQTTSSSAINSSIWKARLTSIYDWSPVMLLTPMTPKISSIPLNSLSEAVSSCRLSFAILSSLNKPKNQWILSSGRRFKPLILSPVTAT